LNHQPNYPTKYVVKIQQNSDTQSYQPDSIYNKYNLYLHKKQFSL